MKRNSKRSLGNLIYGMLIASSFSSYMAMGQEFPSKPMRMVVPFPPGGPGEVIARPVAEGLQAVTGQPVVLDFRAGAGAVAAMQALNSSPADGYTLFVGSNVLALSPWLFKNLPYDPRKDLRAVVSLASSPYLVLVSASFPGSGVADLINAARAAPGKLNFATSGAGTQSQIATELFNDMAGIKMTHVPYKGAGPAILAAMSGEVAVFFDNVFSSQGHVRGGKLKALGVTSLTRVEQLPEVRTVDEQGVKGFQNSAWFGLVVARGVPDAIVTRLNEVANKALQTPQVRERYAKLGVSVSGGSAQELQRHFDAEIETTGRVIRSAGISIE